MILGNAKASRASALSVGKASDCICGIHVQKKVNHQLQAEGEGGGSGEGEAMIERGEEGSGEGEKGMEEGERRGVGRAQEEGGKREGVRGREEGGTTRE